MEPKEPVRARIDAEGVAELATSISEVGLLQPIMVEPRGDDFEVITGNRRLLACRVIKLDPVPCLVIDEPGSVELVAKRMHENMFRRDMTVMEEAVVCAELYLQFPDVDKVCAITHLSRRIVESRLLLMDGDEEIRDAVHAETITLGVAELLNKINDENTRRYLLSCAIRDGASVEKVRLWVKDYSGITLTPVDPTKGDVLNDPAGEAVPDPNICWLCGSKDDQHDLRVRLVHAGCERIARRDAARIQEMNNGEVN